MAHPPCIGIESLRLSHYRGSINLGRSSHAETKKCWKHKILLLQIGKNKLNFIFLTSLGCILDMHTVDIEGRVQPGAVYLKFTEGQNTAYTYLTYGSNTGSFNI